MGSNQVIACWGSPGSGTTLTAAKIALELASLKKNVILVLCDNETPMLPLLAPDIGEAKSLGDLLALPTISPIDIFQHCIPVKSTLKRSPLPNAGSHAAQVQQRQADKVGNSGRTGCLYP